MSPSLPASQEHVLKIRGWQNQPGSDSFMHGGVPVGNKVFKQPNSTPSKPPVSTLLIQNFRLKLLIEFSRIEMGERAALVKFGKHEHISSLREEGFLYMNHLPYFWRIDDQQLRGDPFDGIQKVARGLKGKAILENGTEVPVGNWILREHPADPEGINIFCMYALRPTAGTFPVDERNFQFGDYALVVTNPQRFIDRIGSQLAAQGVARSAALVEYVDDEYTGDIGPFRKMEKFAYQSEWRFVCYDGPGGPRSIQIGSIEDVSIIMPSKEINQIDWAVVS